MFGARVDEQVAPRDHRLMAGKDGERRYNELPGSRNSRSTPTGTCTYARRWEGAIGRSRISSSQDSGRPSLRCQCSSATARHERSPAWSPRAPGRAPRRTPPRSRSAFVTDDHATVLPAEARRLRLAVEHDECQDLHRATSLRRPPDSAAPVASSWRHFPISNPTVASRVAGRLYLAL